MDTTMMFLFSVLIIVFMVVVVGGFFGMKFLPFGPNQNNLCENRWTSALDPNLPNRLEAEMFQSFLTDCCYDMTLLDESEDDPCYIHANAVGETPDGAVGVCVDKTSANPRNLFHCEYSTKLTGDADCPEEFCLQNCNQDGDCQEEEFSLCYDCWGLR